MPCPFHEAQRSGLDVLCRSSEYLPELPHTPALGGARGKNLVCSARPVSPPIHAEFLLALKSLRLGDPWAHKFGDKFPGPNREEDESKAYVSKRFVRKTFAAP